MKLCILCHQRPVEAKGSQSSYCADCNQETLRELSVVNTRRSNKRYLKSLAVYPTDLKGKKLKQ